MSANPTTKGMGTWPQPLFEPVRGRCDILSNIGLVMRHVAATKQAKASSLVLMLVLASLLAMFTPGVQAVGPNQNDLNSSGDLPDNMTVNITNYIFSSTYSGTGELDWGDDDDFIRVALTSTQGLAATLSFANTTTFSNGTTVSNDFDLAFYDSSMNMMTMSWNSNPESVTTNGSTSGHGGMVYVGISRWTGSGAWTLNLYKFTVSSTGGNGTGGPGGGTITNCTGNNTLASDILEPNDSTATASPANMLPLTCTGLSIHSTSDIDFFEVYMIAGTTYYANITFLHANGDIDVSWQTSLGGFLDSGGSVTDDETMQVTASVNQTTYIEVFGYSGATNTYGIDITTDNPGGGQTFETVTVNMVNTSFSTLSFSGLTNGTTYQYNHSYGHEYLDGNFTWSTSVTGNFTANGTTHAMNITTQAASGEGEMYVMASLLSATGTYLHADIDTTYIESVEAAVTSSTSGDISVTNLSTSTTYTLEWVTLDYDEWMTNYSVSNDVHAAINASMIDSDSWSISNTASVSYQVNWTGPTTMNDHLFLAYIYLPGTVPDLDTNENLTGLHFDEFIPQLPALVLNGYSTSSTASTNNVQAKGADLVVGDSYQYQYRVTDASGANLATSSMTSFTATAQNMSITSWSYTTPTSLRPHRPVFQRLGAVDRRRRLFPNHHR